MGGRGLEFYPVFSTFRLGNDFYKREMRGVGVIFQSDANESASCRKIGGNKRPATACPSLVVPGVSLCGKARGSEEKKI